MEIIRIKIFSEFYKAILLSFLSMTAIEAHAVANATPVPFSQPNTTVTEAELHADLQNLEAFMTHIDHYIAQVHTATEKYRKYVGYVKKMLASCEVESDTSKFEGTGFENLIAQGDQQCKGWVAGFDQRAKTYAARLDEAFTFQKMVQQVGEHVQGQMDRYRIAILAQRMKWAVDQGLNELDDTRKAFKPWMSSKLNNH